MNVTTQAKSKCDLLIRNGYVITLDAQRTKYPKGAIAIKDRKIVGVGSDKDISAKFESLRVIDAKGAAVHPGYIDTHYHITAHFGSKMLEDGGTTSGGTGAWIASRYSKFFNNLDQQGEYASALLAGLDMLLNGFTAFVEPGTMFTPDAVAEACQALGLRAWVADPWLMDNNKPGVLKLDRVRLDTKRCLNDLGKQLGRNKDENALVRGHVAIYGGGSQTEELMKTAKAYADESSVTFNTHQSMSFDDAGFDAQRYGKPPYVYYAEQGLLGKNCLFVHSNVLQEEELPRMLESGISLSWVPGNSFYYGMRKKTPNRIPELYHRGLNVTFGLDVSKTWTFGHNTILAYNIAREEQQFLYPDDLLTIQTINGAKAMGANHLLGSLEVGKRADLVIRANSRPWSYPIQNVERDITLHSMTRSVDTVIVDGHIAVKNGYHTSVDEKAVFATAQKAAQRLLKRVDSSK